MAIRRPTRRDVLAQFGMHLDFQLLAPQYFDVFMVIHEAEMDSRGHGREAAFTPTSMVCSCLEPIHSIFLGAMGYLIKITRPNDPMDLTTMPAALLARRLRSSLWCQKQVAAGHRER